MSIINTPGTSPSASGITGIAGGFLSIANESDNLRAISDVPFQIGSGIGAPSGYPSLAEATKAATDLTRGHAPAAALVAQDGRVAIYALDSARGATLPSLEQLPKAPDSQGWFAVSRHTNSRLQSEGHSLRMIVDGPTQLDVETAANGWQVRDDWSHDRSPSR